VCIALAARAGDAGRLPEDPVESKKAEAQWREHMAKEERERRLGYDRRKLKQHQVVFAFLRKARQRYDRARTKRSIARVQASLREPLADMRRRVVAIDHWGNNSNLLEDYGALLGMLEETYPAAAIASLDGQPRALDELRADFDRRTKKIRDWLVEAEASEDE
jgi:hypothetical protein